MIEKYAGPGGGGGGGGGGISGSNVERGGGFGGSGVGKSTTLSILNGTLKPQGGEVLINGYSVYDETNNDTLKGVIGYVPQDDLLIEELTVFQNIYYNAKLCLSNLKDNEIIDAVNKILADFDLQEIKDFAMEKKINLPMKEKKKGKKGKKDKKDKKEKKGKKKKQ